MKATKKNVLLKFCLILFKNLSAVFFFIVPVKGVRSDRNFTKS